MNTPRSFALLMACMAVMSVSHAATVPAVGCASDGQSGPKSAPAPAARQIQLDGEIAAGLAWYFDSSIGVLAPRGWYCLALSGSGGTSLYVTPRQLSSPEMLNAGFKGIQGPAVQLSVAEGGTSGRFIAARRIARLFPHERKFVDDVIAENIEPASAFPSGPYLRDSLAWRGPNAVEYQTAAAAEGLGYDSWLARGDRPITGAVILLDSEHSVLSLAVRLPQELREAGKAIARQVEADNPSMPVAGESRVVTGEAAARLFVSQGKPVHPFCVNFAADSARWNAVALSTCSNAAVVPVTRPDGWREAEYPRNDGPYMSTPFSSYLVLASKGERFLLATENSGGGTGQFSRLRWVRLAGGQLSLSKEEKDGDRCVGGLSGYAAKRGMIEFDQSLSASGIISLSGVAIDKSVAGGLREAPPFCDGAARYRYDPATEKMQLVSVKLNVPELPAITAKDPQACLDRLVRQKGRKTVLQPDELEKFGQAFVDACIAAPR
jgi:hypothetical protein